MKRDSSFVDDDDDAGKIRRKLIKCDCQLSKSRLLFCFLFILNLKRQNKKNEKRNTQMWGLERAHVQHF